MGTKSVRLILKSILSCLDKIKTKYKYRFSVLQEYMPDGDLESRIREHGRMEIQLSFYLLFQVVKALYSLRGVDIMWKDLRTRNILLYYKNGTIAVKIGDYGYNKFVIRF
jgi:serine/threonine protein kinase